MSNISEITNRVLSTNVSDVLLLSGLLLETGVTVKGTGWELADKISSLLLFWFMDAFILMVVDYIDDSFCMK